MPSRYEVLKHLPGRHNRLEDWTFREAEKRNPLPLPSLPSAKARTKKARADYRKGRPKMSKPTGATETQRCRCEGDGWPDTDEFGDRYCVKCGKPR